jgi:tRNA pseudouridine38-40 synthase
MRKVDIFMELAYDGTFYAGWQIQPDAPTVQGMIQNVLTQINANIPVEIIGCGRTDAGVHAHQYFIHFNLDENRCENLVYRMNKMLPSDIKSIEILPLDGFRHARFDAKKRTYRYFISKEKNPFLERYRWIMPLPLDVIAMNDACTLLIGNQDFASFAKVHSDVKTTLCTVYHAHWTETETEYIFEVSANRFLRNMVRAMVGTLVEVGLGKMRTPELAEIIHKKSRQEAAVSVPARGLFLWEVEY